MNDRNSRDWQLLARLFYFPAGSSTPALAVRRSTRVKRSLSWETAWVYYGTTLTNVVTQMVQLLSHSRSGDTLVAYEDVMEQLGSE